MNAIKITDVVSFIVSLKGQKLDTMLLKIAERFPDLTNEQMERALVITVDEMERRGREALGEAEELDAMARVFDGLPQGTTFDDACKIKAAAGDEFAIAWLAQVNSPAYRAYMALLDAALDAHLDWTREDDDIRFVGAGEMPATLDATALIDWFQTHHPVRAMQIEAAIAAGGEGG